MGDVQTRGVQAEHETQRQHEVAEERHQREEEEEKNEQHGNRQNRVRGEIRPDFVHDPLDEEEAVADEDPEVVRTSCDETADGVEGEAHVQKEGGGAIEEDGANGRRGLNSRLPRIDNVEHVIDDVQTVLIHR